MLAWPDLRWAFLPLSDAWGYEYPLLPMSAVGIALGVGLIRGWISGPGERSDARRAEAVLHPKTR